MRILKTYIFSTIAVLFLTAMALTVPLQAQTSNESFDTLLRFMKHFDNDRRAEAQQLLDEILAGKEPMDMKDLVRMADFVASDDRIDMLRQLLDYGVDPDAIVRGDKRPIYKSIIDGAAAAGQLEALRLLLERGGDPGTALFYAAEHKKAEAVQMLLDWGADVNDTWSDVTSLSSKKTPLHVTVEEDGYLENALATARLLIDHGANVNALTLDNTTPLFNAVDHSPDLVKLLLEHGADPNTSYTFLGETTISEAISAYIDVEDKFLMLRMLLEAGADPNIRLNFFRKDISPLTYAKHQDLKIQELLKEYGATIEGKYGNIQDARKAGRVEEVRSFLDRDVSVNSRHEDGCTLLLHAIQYGQMEMVELLLDRGASVNSRNNHGSTALLVAPQYQDDPTYVRLLLNKGSDVNATCVDGDTSLHILAMFRDNIDLAKVLLAGGADIDAKNKKGQTAYDIAVSKGRKKLAAMLLENGAK